MSQSSIGVSQTGNAQSSHSGNAHSSVVGSSYTTTGGNVMTGAYSSAAFTTATTGTARLRRERQPR